MEIRAIECASAHVSDFGRLSVQIDAAEVIAGDRPGGPSFGDVMAVRSLEAQLPALQPQTLDDWQWLARRLARALEGGWEDMAVPLIRLASADRFAA
ncbi:hypothetical protein [Croceicoccus naphthovorans]|nr:hypothetical protein [Croceicoccus naphthovorans]MBB3991077.1 hypothetical protein [Croceicoccus naphthovorans]